MFTNIYGKKKFRKNMIFTYMYVKIYKYIYIYIT